LVLGHCLITPPVTTTSHWVIRPVFSLRGDNKY
jgi:hypothetical protein